MARSKIILSTLLLFGVGCFALWPEIANAAGLSIAACPAARTDAGSIDKVLDMFQYNLCQGGVEIQKDSESIFWLLVKIDFALAGINFILEGREISDFPKAIAENILFVGFFLYVLQNGPMLLSTIISSFQMAGSHALSGMHVSSDVGPQSIVTSALHLVKKAFEVDLGLGAYIAMVITGLIALVALLFTAAGMAETLIESYFVCTAGLLLLGFGGSRFTNDNSVGQLRYAMSVGFKYLVMQLIAGIALTILNPLESVQIASVSDFLPILVTAIALLAIMRSLPSICASVVSGSSQGSARSMAAAVGTAAKGMAATAAGLVGGLVAVNAARAGAPPSASTSASSGGSGPTGGKGPTPGAPPTQSGSGGGGSGGTSGGSSASGSAPQNSSSSASSAAGGGVAGGSGGDSSSGPGSGAASSSAAESSSPSSGQAEGGSSNAAAQKAANQTTLGRLGRGLMRDMSRNTLGGRIAANIKAEDLRARRMERK